FGHWAWGAAHTGGDGWLGARGFVDFAGSTVVHSVGGWVALAAVLVIGPRRGRFEDGQVHAIPPSNLPLCMLGLLLFMVGWIGFNGGSTLEFTLAVPGIVANTLLAGAVGASTAGLLRSIVHPDSDAATALLNGTLAGLVAITAGCHAVTAVEAAAIGAVGALIMLLADRALLAWRIDDAVGAIPVHLAAGAWGTLAVGLLGDLERLGTGLDRTSQVLVQLEGILACGVWAFGIAFLVLRLRGPRRPLRVSAEAEQLGLNVAEHGARTPLLDLLEVMERQQRSGDLGLRAPVEPFTEVGQIADSYNRVMQALEAATVQTKQIVRDIRDGIITFTRDGILTSLNPGAAKLLCLDPQLAIGKPLETVLRDGGISGDIAGLADGRTVGAAARRSVELARVSAPGERAVLEMTAFETLVDGDRAYTALVRDITERRLFEDQLFREKELAQVTLESLGEGVITTDAGGRVTYLNPVAQAITGHTQLHARLRPLSELLQFCDEETGERVVFGAGGQDVWRVERHDALVLRRKDGTEVVVSLNAAPIRDREFVPIGVVIVFQDVSKARELERQLSYQASHDAVTGLINRREFERRLREMMAQARTDQGHHVLCYVDLDQFKLVNDTCGHNAGDELLRQLGGVLSEQLRASDTLARLGGDEFGVIFNSCTTERGMTLADELRETIEHFRFKWRDGIFSVGASIGVVGISGHAVSAAEIMSMADAACYVAKDAGRNRVHLHQPNDRDTLERRGQMQWAARIQHAIDEDRLCLYYQPIVPLDPARSADVHYEVFVRMLDEHDRLVPPGAFIPAAERYDLMTAIDRWVVRNTLAFMGATQDDPVNLAINLSGASITNAEFLANIKAQILHYGVDPQRISFEVTETAAIADLAKARTFINELKLLGCRFALDDFGSGLSSFGYLKTLPVDFLKIDGIFVRDLLKDPVDRAMVESINNVGHLMNLQTIAEFVESEAACVALREIGVDFVQGYHLGEPRPIAELRAVATWPR
ncbi:MAG: EAL domain-containing protein, partial [Gammaproteobacteria bacterium]